MQGFPYLVPLSQSFTHFSGSSRDFDTSILFGLCELDKGLYLMRFSR
jgi:hypothetical protein